jgi:membrane-anchored mycosin MYCP
VPGRVIRAAAVIAALLLSSDAVLDPQPAAAQPETRCEVKVGAALNATPWPQTRLDFERTWLVTDGAGVRVAVIDSGVDTRHPQLSRIHLADGIDVIDGFDPHDVRDCYGHGTAVTGIIAAPRVPGEPFVGVAPGVTIVPIKQTNTQGDKTGTAAGIARGIEAAIAARARVVNISVTVTSPTPALRAAVASAAAHDVVIVAAAGNDGQGNNFAAYPAAYSTQFGNVIAVSASDQSDGIGQFADAGSYVTVAAPGVADIVPAPIRGYRKDDGTSYAAPYVTGTVALVRAAHPELTAEQVRRRIEATADRPPQTVPDPRYGYGIVNPYLAVTAVRDDGAIAASPAPAAPLPAPAPVRPADRHLEHLALGAGVALLGLALLAAAGSVVLRRVSTARARAV